MGFTAKVCGISPGQIRGLNIIARTMAAATRATRRLGQRPNPRGREMGLEMRRRITGQATTRLPSPVMLAEQGTTIGRDKPRTKGIGAAAMRRRVRPKELHRVVRAVAEQTQEGIISVQAARRRVEISMVAAMWIEDTDSRVGDGQTRRRLPRVPPPETRRPGHQQGIRLQL